MLEWKVEIYITKLGRVTRHSACLNPLPLLLGLVCLSKFLPGVKEGVLSFQHFLELTREPLGPKADLAQAKRAGRRMREGHVAICQRINCATYKKKTINTRKTYQYRQDPTGTQHQVEPFNPHPQALATLPPKPKKGNLSKPLQSWQVVVCKTHHW